jgi:hypothetical protein
LRSVNFSVRKSFPSDINKSKAKKQGDAAMKEQIAELRLAAFVETDDFPIEHSFPRKWQRHLLAKVCERVEGISVARDQFGSTILDDDE